MKRRAYLKASGGLAALSVAGLSGCVGAPRADDARLRWFVSPPLFEDELEHYVGFATRPNSIAAERDHLDQEIWSDYEAAYLDWAAADPTAEDVELLLTIGNGDAFASIAQHTLGADDIVEHIEAEGLETAESRNGFRRYSSGDGTEARAVTNTQYLSVTSPAGALDAVDALVDSSRGAVARYHEVDANVRTVLNEIGEHQTYRFRGMPEQVNVSVAAAFDDEDTDPTERGVFEGAVARGMGSTLEDGQLRATYVEVFASEAAAEEADVETFIESDQHPLFAGATDITSRIENSVSFIEWTADSEQVTLATLLGQV